MLHIKEQGKKPRGKAKEKYHFVSRPVMLLVTPPFRVSSNNAHFEGYCQPSVELVVDGLEEAFQGCTKLKVVFFERVQECR